MSFSQLRSALCISSLWLAASFAHAAEFTAEKNDHGVAIRLNGEPFAEYLTACGRQPAVWPIVGPTGKRMTRAYPMEEIAGETKDHPHHRSLWFNHGDVNGVDFWTDEETSGTIVHREFVEVKDGEAATVATRNDWRAPSGTKICEDERRLTFAADGDHRIIDFDVTVTASEGPVTFGDTKEGAFAVRVPDSMAVDAKLGGRIVNSAGQTDESAWGQPANWVDYYGPVDGETLGIAILNHPSSFRFPTCWHVRTYGLFAANPFGAHDFKQPGPGEHKLEQGETMTLRYRVIFHRGNEQDAKIAEAAANYSRLTFPATP